MNLKIKYFYSGVLYSTNLITEPFPDICERDVDQFRALHNTVGLRTSRLQPRVETNTNHSNMPCVSPSQSNDSEFWEIFKNCGK